MFARSKQGAIQVIAGTAPLNVENVSAARSTLDDCLKEGHFRAVLDMQGIALIDSSGLELLLDIQDAFEQRAGTLKLAAPNALCREIFAVTGVGSRFEIFSEAKGAVGSFVQ